MTRIKKRCLLLVFPLILLVSIIFLPFYMASPIAHKDVAVSQEFVVESGESLKHVIKRLKENKEKMDWNRIALKRRD